MINNGPVPDPNQPTTAVSSAAGRDVDTVALPRIGLGTVAIGGLYSPVSADEAASVLTAALQRGIRYFDTAPMYGQTTAERRLGSFLERAGSRDELVLSTKVGRLLRPRRLAGATPGADFGWRNPGPFIEQYDYSYDGIYRSVEDSLQRIGTDYFDVVHIHDIGRLTHGAADDRHHRQLQQGGYRALEELRASGVVHRLGVGVNEIEALLRTVGEIDLDCALLAGRFNLLEQPDDDLVYRRCAERGVQLIAGGIYAAGALAGARQYNYTAAPPDILDAVARLAAVCRRHDVDLPDAALQFVAAQPGYHSILLGPRDPAELDSSLDALSRPVPAELWHELAEEGLIAPRWVPTPAEDRSP